MIARARVPQDLVKKLNAELGPGERLLYAAQPDWRAQWVQHLITFVFGLGWSSICVPIAAACWMEVLGLMPAGSKASMGFGLALFFSLFLIPFVVIGLACLVSPWMAARSAKRTVHAVSSQRLLNMVGNSPSSAESINLQSVNFIKRRDGRDGYGSLSIGYGVENDSDGAPRPITTEWPGVPEAKRAEAIIREHASWAR